MSQRTDTHKADETQPKNERRFWIIALIVTTLIVCLGGSAFVSGLVWERSNILVSFSGREMHNAISMCGDKYIATNFKINKARTSDGRLWLSLSDESRIEVAPFLIAHQSDLSGNEICTMPFEPFVECMNELAKVDPTALGWENPATCSEQISGSK